MSQSENSSVNKVAGTLWAIAATTALSAVDADAAVMSPDNEFFEEGTFISFYYTVTGTTPNPGSVAADFYVDGNPVANFTNESDYLTATDAFYAANDGVHSWRAIGNYSSESSNHTFDDEAYFTVTNVPATIQSATIDGFDGDAYINQGDTAYFEMTTSDPGDDSHGYTIYGNSAGTGSDVGGSLRTSDTASGTFYTPGSESIEFIVYDGTENTYAYRTVNITNLAPELMSYPAYIPVDFSVTSQALLEATAIDPGIYDSFEFYWDLDGDGEYDDLVGGNATFDFATLSGLIDGQFITAGVEVRDEYGSSNYKSFDIQIVNLPEPTSLGLISLVAMTALRRRSK